MKNLTKKQRNEVYKKALEIQKEERVWCTVHRIEQTGLCPILHRSACTIFPDVALRHTISSFVETLPEFMKLKPTGRSKGTYWWTTKPNSRIREAKLRQIIDETP